MPQCNLHEKLYGHSVADRGQATTQRGEAEQQQTTTVSESVDVEQIALRLCTDPGSAWERTIHIGRVVFEGIVGNEADWRSRRGNKKSSLRRLIEHPACPFGKTTLSAAVNIYLFVERNPSIVERRGITPTHVALVTGLGNDEALALLQHAADQHWSIRKLAVEAKLLRKRATGERNTAPLATVPSKATALSMRALHCLRSLFDLVCLGTLSEHERRSLQASLDEVGEALVLLRRLPELRRGSVLGPGDRA